MTNRVLQAGAMVVAGATLSVLSVSRTAAAEPAAASHRATHRIVAVHQHGAVAHRPTLGIGSAVVTHRPTLGIGSAVVTHRPTLGIGSAVVTHRSRH